MLFFLEKEAQSSIYLFVYIYFYMLSAPKKAKLIHKIQLHKNDTGSSQVQIALLTEKIKALSRHLKKHPKDNHSRRGLLKMVAKRKKLVEYLKRKNEAAYKSLAKTLGLNKK